MMEARGKLGEVANLVPRVYCPCFLDFLYIIYRLIFDNNFNGDPYFAKKTIYFLLLPLLFQRPGKDRFKQFPVPLGPKVLICPGSYPRGGGGGGGNK